LEPGEDPATTAAREVDEEAGAVGQLGRLLDVFENKDRKTRTYVYVLMVEHLKDEYDDAKGIGRDRKWFSLLEAIMRLREHKPVQTAYLQKLIQDKDHIQKSHHCPSSRLQNTYAEILNKPHAQLIINQQQRFNKINTSSGDATMSMCEGCKRWSQPPRMTPPPPSTANNNNNSKEPTTTTNGGGGGGSVDNNNVIYSPPSSCVNTSTPCTQTQLQQTSTPAAATVAAAAALTSNGHTSCEAAAINLLSSPPAATVQSTS